MYNTNMKLKEVHIITDRVPVYLSKMLVGPLFMLPATKSDFSVVTDFFTAFILKVFVCTFSVISLLFRNVSVVWIVILSFVQLSQEKLSILNKTSVFAIVQRPIFPGFLLQTGTVDRRDRIRKKNVSNP